MGDVGVACMPLHHNNIMEERFPVEDKPTALCSTSTTTTATPIATAVIDNNNNNNTTMSNQDSNGKNDGNDGTKGNTTGNGVKPKAKKITKRIIKVKRVVPVRKSSKNKWGLQGEANSSKERVTVDNLSSVTKDLKKDVDNSKEIGSTLQRDGMGLSEDMKASNKVDNNMSAVDKGGSQKEVKTGEEINSSSISVDVELQKESKGINEIEKEQESAKLSDSVDVKLQNHKDEVEEGELGTLKWPPRVEIDNGELDISEKPSRGEFEKGEIATGKWRKGEKGEKFYGKWRKHEYVRDDFEKGEFFPDRWHSKDEYGYGKFRGRFDEGNERTPLSGKYSGEDIYRRKEFFRIGSSHHGKTSSKWHSSQNRRTKINSKIMNDESFYKGDYMNGKNHGREYSSGNRLKRHGMDSDYSEKRHHGDYLDYAGSRTRRLAEDSTRSAHSEHYSRHSVERFYKNSSSSKYSSHEKFSSRHHEPNFSSKGVFDRHGRSRSPGYSEWSPHDRTWYYDVRDLSPMRRERTPYGRERSPHGRERSHARDRSPYGRQRSPCGRERSPYGRERSPYSRERSPYGYDRSPYGRERSPYSRERSLSPYSRERSPYSQEKSPFRHERSPSDRSGHHDHRNSSPSYIERSPLDRKRYQDRSDQTPSYCEQSTPDGVRPSVSLETSKKGEAIEKGISQRCDTIEDDKVCGKDSNNGESQLSLKGSQDTNNMNGFSESNDKNINELQKEEKSESPSTLEKSPLIDGAPLELVSMEEDMDICDTPPHIPFVSDSSIGKWFYLDYLGVERGPSKLSELKVLVDEGVLEPDYFIKHSDSDRWVTIENAVSPLVPTSFPPIVSESITHLVNPPQTQSKLLVDTVNTCYSGSEIGELPVSLAQPPLCSNENEAHSEALQDCCIDERVGLLMEGFTVTPGSELETIGEALQTTFELVEWDVLGNPEGFTDIKACDVEQNHQNTVGITGCSDMNTLEVEAPLNAMCEKDPDFSCSMVSTEWFSSQWSCKGGDWKRNDDNMVDRFSRRKFVLNDGYPLCQMPKSGYEDPRWLVKDDLYYPSQSGKLDLPPWAFSGLDDRTESGSNRSNLSKPPVSRAMRGAMLPVVRINACVVNDHGSLVSESRSRSRAKDRHSSRSARAYSSTNDVKGALSGYELHSRVNDQGLNGSWKSFISINTPKDRLSTVDELQLHLGEWYYLDGTGHEQGPLSFAELQILADQGVIQKHSSIFRKLDRVWVPITSASEISEGNCKTQSDSNHASARDSSSNQIIPGSIVKKESHPRSSTFHTQHPQFIGYTRGRLHELVMRSFKSREFAAAVNEVLDPWINVKQPKKEIDNHIYWKSDIDARAVKRARLLINGRDEDLEKEDNLTLKDEISFEELCGDATFLVKENACPETEAASWGFLDGHVLSRVFHFLRSDVKSLAYASLTCKHWRAAVNFYKGISRQVDLSSIGSSCTDSIIWNIMNGYNNEKLILMVLGGCSNVTSAMLEEILHSFPRLSSIDIRGCNQFGRLVHRFPNIRWLKDRCVPAVTISEDSNAKIRSLNQITSGASASYKTNGLTGDTDDFGNLKEYFDSVNKRDTSQLFHRSLYKRSKLFDARKSSSILSRDARMRRWSIKKTENGYRRMEWFLVSALKDIMKENIFDFFVPKIAEIEDKIKSGYYVGRGLKSVKEDISRLCRNAIKAKNQVGGDIKPIITLFLRLASHLNERHKFSYERDELMKAWKEDLSDVLGSASSKYKKKLVTDRKYSSRSSVSLYANDSSEFGEYASDREIRRRLSKLNRKSLDSGSETSEDSDRSTEDGRSNAESTASETDSDSDTRPGQAWETRGDSYFTADESIDSNTDDREWGARMTKASLVPPVTRKYEVIDQYAIVADEEDVRRKMSVSLPDDYAEKLDAQKNGTEECDMELPEVKDYKPRKELGHEVTEQEVYGIDPYTHNLLLDSMPKELGWSQLDKHMFIEDVLLCTLNKQVRHFTGTGNTPMMFPLRPVVEEIEKTADRDCDIRTMRMCRGILKAISSRPEDKYVAYRKGLGVVCNKEGGFGTDDFVVEFLGEVYPAWKWYEKQDGIRSLQKDSKEPAPEFYNIYLERPKGDGDGYDLVVVDAMHKANYASRICHSCRPNCEAKVTAVNGQYQIGIYTTRGIQYGEEITFDYNSVTESKEEYEASVCLCGSQFCRGSYLNLTGEGAFQKVLKEWHGTLDRVYLMLEACELNSVSEEDYLDLGRAGISNCLLHGLPDWVIAYSARLVRFINLERTKLPEAILRHNLEEKRKYFSDIDIDVERSDAEVQAEGVYNQRLQNVAITLNKVRYVMRCLFGDSKDAPPPLEKLTPEETVYFLWKGEGSLVEELLQCLAPYIDVNTMNDLKSKIREHDPLDTDNVQKQLRKSLLWLRDEVRNLPCSYKCRNDAAADLIHVYAYTKCFFRVREYSTYTSPPVYISPLDLGPKHADELGEGVHEYRKTYGENYCLGQLIFWHVQTNAEPDCSLVKASRGCLLLPEIGSFYAKVQKPSQQRIYGPKTLKTMLDRMEKYSQKAWPKDQIWTFKASPKIYGSPMLDAVLNNTSLDREMLHWLKHRPLIYQAMWDR